MLSTNVIFFLFLKSMIAAAQSCSIVSQSSHTFYGFPDNDPPGPATAYDCAGRNFTAGGIGTYDNPLTVAAAPSALEQCELLYDPYLKKYLRVEDFCQACTDDWANGIWRIDTWTGSPTINGGDNQKDCENALTPALESQSFVRSPSAGLEVDGMFCSLVVFDTN